ncbi:MATE family efflux transporter [Leisingera sp. ANG-Vp]|uniref:MATE family efflux transporter n=1 Tax=Leisingera sp. ANG-Vp TaxID=1577896 RepID=UPI00057D16DB|nr:MATE family efflux transporter [Leisingera sp. ANG-Vp]KIC18734.1 multidrug transporter MatE [Leisingera sp. ANG-Vp]
MADQPEKKAVFLTGSLMGHVTRMSLTASIGLMAMFAVDFVDMAFIAMLGNDALAAAVGYAGTLLFFTNSINIGLSIAAGSLVARALGAGQPDDARRNASSVAVIGALTGLLVPILVLSYLNPVLALLGAEGEVLRLAARYVTIILPTMWVMALGMSAMAVLRAHGDARRAMLATLYGGGLNAVLDPILIFGVGLGLDGAAIASVLARVCMLIAALWPAIRVHQGFMRPSLRQIAGDIRAIRAIAVPAVLTNVATPVGSAIVIREIAQFGTDAVAGMAVIGRLMPVAFSVIFALSGAIGPIVGQNFGAQLFPRVRQAFLAGIAFTAIYTLLVAAVLFALRAPIADLFTATGETRSLIYLFCGPLALMLFFNGVIFVENASFNNLGHPVYSTWINWGRHTLGTWPLAVLGGYLAGAPGVLLGQAFGGMIFAGLGFMLVRRVLSRLEQPADVDAFAPQNRLHALLGRRSW